VGKPYPYGGEGYPYPDPLTGGSLADVVTGFFFRGRRARRRRRLADEGTRSDAAASATQYGRHVSDLRSTNGHVQAKANGDELFAIETYGGVISFNLEECWYLEHA